MTEDIRGKEIQEISTETLIRAITIDAADYTESFIERARAELSGSRDVDVHRLGQTVVVRSPDGVTTCSIDEALESVRGADPWSFREIAVPTGDALVVNALKGCWSVRYRDAEGESVGVLAFRDQEAIGDVARPLLELSPDWRRTAERFQDAKWEVLTTSNSIEHLVAVAEELAGRELVYTIRTASTREMEAASWMSVRRDGAQLLVQPEDWSAAESVMKAIEKEVEDLFARAERYADEKKVDDELACYERLGRLRPGDALVHYNRAAILMDLDRKEAAADAFMEAAPLLARDEQLARYVGEVATHLEELRESYPSPTLIAHTLAAIALQSEDFERACALYAEIVAADESDAAAHAALGRLLFESGDDDEAAAKHLARYLELEPDAPDRESVEQALEQLRSEA